MYVYVYPLHAWHSWKPDDGLDFLELVLQMVVICHVGAENETLVFWMSSQWL